MLVPSVLSLYNFKLLKERLPLDRGGLISFCRFILFDKENYFGII